MNWLISSFLAVHSFHGVLKSQSLEDLFQARKLSSKEQYLRLLCQKQLSGKKIPTACYERANKEKNQEFLQYLDEKCLELPPHTLSLNNIAAVLKNPYLSPQCQNFLLKKQKILKYQSKDTPPF